MVFFLYMITRKTCFFSVVLFSLLVFSSGSCDRPDKKDKKLPGSFVRHQKDQTILVRPERDAVFYAGEQIEFEISSADKEVSIDSVCYYLRGKKISTMEGKFFHWDSEGTRVGQHVFRAKVFYNDSLADQHNANFTVLSDITPVKYEYEVVNSFPHDENAYVQGLLYEGGFLYESTGQRGKSSVRKVDIASGQAVKKHDLDKRFFGEGITLFDDKIYQLTYHARVGFVYNKDNLDLVRQFDLQVNEGWGLTSDDEHLIMSDGSSRIYLLDPAYLTQVDEIEVFDNKGMVNHLNELEYVNNKIYANVYGKTRIVMIDPDTGKVLGELDLSKLMPKEFIGDMDYVLNGIAYNPSSGNFYVTGKYWPVLYEIKILE